MAGRIFRNKEEHMRSTDRETSAGKGRARKAAQKKAARKAAAARENIVGTSDRNADEKTGKKTGKKTGIAAAKNSAGKFAGKSARKSARKPARKSAGKPSAKRGRIVHTEQVIDELRFVEQDETGGGMVYYEFEKKSAQINIRMPHSLVKAVKAQAARRGMPYQRFIREAIERALK